MDTTTRYRATDQLTATLRDQERSRRWLARKMKVSATLLTLLVQGKRTVSAEPAHRAAEALGAPFGSLFVPVEEETT